MTSVEAHPNSAPPPLEAIAAVAGRLEDEGFFAPCPGLRAEVVAYVAGARDDNVERHLGVCLDCAAAVDALLRAVRAQ
ncbi:MAG: hypothetical protein ACR2L8_06515, partial [Solirubrobacteraceae bacterium]